MISPSILQHEFIGLKVKVVKSSQPHYLGITGMVVDETRNTLVVKHKKQYKTIVKDVATFHFTTSDGTVVEIDGRVIVERPQGRVKKRVRKRW